MAMVLDNPAARLHTVLQALNTVPPNTASHNALAQALMADTGDHADFARRISVLLSLPDQVVTEINQVDEILSRDILLRWYEPVSNALKSSLFFTGPVGQITQRYNEGDLVALHMCSDVLHRHRREALLSDAELDRITKLIDDLRETLLRGEHINSELRDVLLFHVHAMQQAIHDMPLRGTVGLQHAAAQTWGMMAFRPDLVAKQEKNADVWQKLTAVLGAVAAALSFGTATLQALEAPPAPPPVNMIVIGGQANPIVQGAQHPATALEPNP